MNIMRIIIVALSLVLGIGCGRAEDGLAVRNVVVARDGKAMLAIETAFESDVFFGYELKVQLPKGLSIALNSSGKPVAESHTDLDIVGSVLSTTADATTYQFVASKMGNPRIPAGSYVLATMPIESDGTLAVGSELACSVNDILFSDGTQTGRKMQNLAFTVTVSDKVVLDENSPVVPMATDGSTDLLVKRTIKAGEWSTLCLPFEMDGAQVEAAFGDDVELAEFDSYELNDDGAIEVFFTESDPADGLYSNWPYIVKTSRAIAEFELHAQVEPDEEAAVTKYETGKGKNKKTVGTFTGTLHAGTVIPQSNLFLNGNKFYYSVGKTKSKAFRAYFWFEDLIADLGTADARISLHVDERQPSAIATPTGEAAEAVPLYDLQGRQVEQPVKKGIYVRAGKKIVTK